MKLYRSLFPLLFLLCATGLHAQEAGEISKMKAEEAKTYLEEQIENIEALQRIAGMKLSIEPGDKNEEEDYELPYGARTAAQIKQDLDSVFAAIRFEQYISYPDAVIALSEDGDFAAKAERLYKYAGAYTIKTIYFKEGSSKTVNEKADGEFTLKDNPRPVDRIEVTAEYTRPGSIKKISLSPKQAVFSEDGIFAELKSIKGSTASLLTSGIASENVLRIQAENAAGKTLSFSNGTNRTLPPREMMEALDEYKKIYETALKNFAGFKDMAQLEQHLQQEIKKHPVPENRQNMTYISHTYRGTVAAVNIFIQTDNVNEKKTFTVKPERELQEEYVIALDSKTEQFGLLDRQGKWFVNPTFTTLRYAADGLYAAAPADAKENKNGFTMLVTYRLDKTTRTLVPLGFEPVENINSHLMLVQRETNGPYGVYDKQSGKMVLPMKYVNVQIAGELLTCRIGERTYSTDGPYGGFTVYGKEVVPARFKDVDTDGSYFYTNSGDSVINGKKLSRIDIRDVYNNKGEKLNPDGTYTIGAFENAQPILTITATEKYSFIDSTGKKVIDASEYEEVQPFSNGMAIVKKGDKKGAIDISGQLVIPLVYDDLYSFQTRYALAGLHSSNRREMLIDKKNKVVKEFEGSIFSSSIPKNSNDAVYYMNAAGGSVKYDADGNQVKKD